ncbi:aldehyde dehydrogenase [Marasmius fiardii PR-910]|nr:aldehyde dehydrogenase [Marasmius fiardii PR-910]
MPPFTPLFINGQETPSSSNNQFEIHNPLSGEVVGTAASATSEDCKAAIISASNAFKLWSQTTLGTRRDLFIKAADLVVTDKYKAKVIESVMEETGASHAMGMFNWTTASGFLRSCAMLVRDLRGERFNSERGPGTVVWTEKRPLGVIFTQSPWNAPFTLTLRAVVVPILCGNTVVFRPSELSPRACAVVHELFQEAGLPNGVYNFVSISKEDTPRLTSEIIAHPLVRKVTFTGSDRVGRIIAMEAAKHLKPCVLELGGKAPAVVIPFRLCYVMDHRSISSLQILSIQVLNDANVKEAARSIVTGAMLHSGQICMSTERVIVQGGVGEALTEEILNLVGKLKAGDPQKEKLGPLFSADHAENVLSLLRESQVGGAQILLGDVSRKGAVVGPHVLTDVKPGMKLWDRESFGPVVSLSVVETVDEAVELANASDYSLTSSLWTSDIYKAHEVASRINAGYTNINGSTIHSEPTIGLIGLGGSSGYGRFGVDDFTYEKVVVVHPTGQPSVLLD